jgi:Phosphotransferase system cellobiose-specific component IIA
MTETVIFEIILHAGNARAEAYEALAAARTGDFAKAAGHLARAEEEIGIAHRTQVDIIQREAAGEKQEISLLFVHAQDHLMTAIAEKNLISHMIGMEKTIRDLTARLEAKQ